MIPLAHFDQLSLLILVSTADHESCVGTALLDPGSDVNKDWTCKDKYKDFTYSYLLQVAAKPIQSLSSNNNEHKVKVHNICKTHYTE